MKRKRLSFERVTDSSPFIYGWKETEREAKSSHQHNSSFYSYSLIIMFHPTLSLSLSFLPPSLSLFRYLSQSTWEKRWARENERYKSRRVGKSWHHNLLKEMNRCSCWKVINNQKSWNGSTFWRNLVRMEIWRMRRQVLKQVIFWHPDHIFCSSSFISLLREGR